MTEVKLPEGFRKGTRPRVDTVGELIDELSQLPRGMKFRGEYQSLVRVVVMNVNKQYLAAMLDEQETD